MAVKKPTPPSVPRSKYVEIEKQISGTYFCPSDGRTYEITHLDIRDKPIVCGHCLDCQAGDGNVRMHLEEFFKRIRFKTFIKNPHSDHTAHQDG